MQSGRGYGVFGKLPGLGDFLQYSMPAGFVRCWDDWLQQGMLSAREALGSGWHEAYFSAPIWRFSLSEGLCGPAPVSGILMCSVDRVGREFPLTVLRELPKEADAIAAHLTMAVEFEALESVALDAMEDESGRDALQAALAAVPSVETSRAVRALHTGGAGPLSFTLPEGGAPAPAVASALAGRLFAAPSVWSALTPRGTRFLLYEGMPDARELATFWSPERSLHSDR